MREMKRLYLISTNLWLKNKMKCMLVKRMISLEVKINLSVPIVLERDNPRSTINKCLYPRNTINEDEF